MASAAPAKFERDLMGLNDTFAKAEMSATDVLMNISLKLPVPKHANTYQYTESFSCEYAVKNDTIKKFKHIVKDYFKKSRR